MTEKEPTDWEGIVLNVGIWIFFAIILTFAAIKTVNRIKEQKDIMKSGRNDEKPEELWAGTKAQLDKPD